MHMMYESHSTDSDNSRGTKKPPCEAIAGFHREAKGKRTNEEDYEQFMRRCLELTRREKGHEHVETLAHLTALAIHLEKMGKHTEAKPLTEERDRLSEILEENRE